MTAARPASAAGRGQLVCVCGIETVVFPPLEPGTTGLPEGVAVILGTGVLTEVAPGIAVDVGVGVRVVVGPVPQAASKKRSEKPKKLIKLRCNRKENMFSSPKRHL